jgi:hypothetical protein
LKYSRTNGGKVQVKKRRIEKRKQLLKGREDICVTILALINAGKSDG